MIDEIFRNNLIIREWVNGGLIPLNLSLVIVIGLFLWGHFRESVHFGAYIGGWERFQHMDGVATACALLWIFLADGIRATGAWLTLNFGSRVEELVSWLFIIAGLMAIAACLRCIHLFTPPHWGHRYWLLTVAVTIVFQIVA